MSSGLPEHLFSSEILSRVDFKDVFRFIACSREITRTYRFHSYEESLWRCWASKNKDDENGKARVKGCLDRAVKSGKAVIVNAIMRGVRNYGRIVSFPKGGTCRKIQKT